MSAVEQVLVLFEEFDVGSDHFTAELLERVSGLPAQDTLCFRGIADEEFDLGWAEIAGVNGDADGAGGFVNALFIDALALPIQRDAHLGECHVDEVADGDCAASGENVVIRGVLLEHAPHAFDVVLGVAPVALRVEVAEVQGVLQAEVDAGHAAGDLAGHERLAAKRAFVVEQDAVGGVHAVALAVVFDNPETVEFRNAIRAAWVERRGFALGNFLDQTIQLRRRCLVKPDVLLHAQDAHRFEDAEGPDAIGVCRVFGGVEADLDVAHRGEVVDLVGLHLLDDPDEVRGVGEIAVVQLEPDVGFVRILVQMVNPVRVEERGPALDPMHFVTLFEQQFCQISSVLTGDAGDQRAFPSHVLSD